MSLMASQFSQSDEVLNIHFVIPTKHANEDNCSEDMWEAFNKCKENEMSPVWIDEKRCGELEPTKTDIFVMEEFTGELFEKLKTTKCLILGPRCLLSCFMTGEPVPPGTSPVFISAMNNMVICVSGFSTDIKEKIQQQVEYMGGIYIKQLRNCTTHLISDSVTSAKYEKATELGLPIYNEKWVSAVWETNLNDYVNATNSIFDKYKCSVFMNLVVTSTNLAKREKMEVKKLIEEHGGKFMGPLDGSKVTLVIAKEYTTLSDKLKYALQNRIPCVKNDWVINSVKAGYALPFNDYLITPAPKQLSSTPEKGSQVTQVSLNFSTISNIPCENIHNYVNETMTNTLSSTVASGVDRHSVQYTPSLEKLDIREAKRAGPFLDGCNIYITGFPLSQREKINRILNVGSATRLDDISDALTHVLVGDPSKAANELKTVQSRGLHPHILTIEWLEESIKLEKPAPEELYLLDKREKINTKTKDPPPSPLSKKSLQMLQKPKRPPVPLFDIDKATFEDDEPNIVQQYLQISTSDRSLHDVPRDISTDCDSNRTKVTSRSQISKSETSQKEPDNDSEVPLSQTGTMSEQIFQGLTFRVAGFDDEEGSIVLANISGLGGQLVSNSYVGIPDYGIVPLTGTTFRHTVNELVTNLFIEDCIDNEKVVDIEYYHRPLSIPSTKKPLANCVIATSSYMGVERTYLASLANALGAHHQDSFARKTNLEKGQYGGTHLVCTSPKGNKYNAAVKWRLPAVTAEWLIACAEKLRFVDETPYLVGETKAPEREHEDADISMGPPATTSRHILTPKRNLPQTPGMETPIINKHLRGAKGNDPKSPFHVDTPQSPYGQIFKPNPSPGTRKDWAKWIDDLPDAFEPPAKRRAPSTPLSDLKRQIWSAMKKPIQPNDRQNESFQATEENNSKSVDVSRDTEDEGANNPPINRQLSYEDDDKSPKNELLNEQLEKMAKVLRATSSEGSRYSSNENAKVYDEPDRGNHYAIPATQAESVGWEEPRVVSKETVDVMDDIQEENLPKNKKFMMSGLRDRSSYMELITQLGGEVSMESYFDSTATHLICMRPLRNEKLLGSIAAGKWVLHFSYIRDCEAAGEFIDEEKYEWGNPRSKETIPTLENDLEKSLAASAYRWRIKLQNNKSIGAFSDIVAMLMVPRDRHDQFERLIKAGGGQVVEMKSPYNFSPTGKKVTHCFIQVNKLEQPVDWAMLASKGILCFSPHYLNEHIMAVDPINPRDCVIPEFKKYLALLPK